MAYIARLNSGSWRAVVRRKGQYASRTFHTKADAKRWADDVERKIDRGQSITSPSANDVQTIAHLIDLHVQDMCDVGQAPLKSKAGCLAKLRREIGRLRTHNLTRDAVVSYGKRRAKEGAGPVTVSMEVGYLRTILLHASSIHGLPSSAMASSASPRNALVARHPTN